MLGGAALAAALAAPLDASADEAPSTGAPPKIDLTTEAPEPPQSRSFRVHDGFYLRGNVGFGWHHAAFEDDTPLNLDISATSFDMGFDLMIGGTPSPGFTIGGALMFNALFAADFEQRGRSAGTRDLGVVILGPFIDAFPNKKKGWHLGGAVGIVGVQDREAERELNGFGAAVWGGHDFWVADEFSIGPFVRFAGTLTRDKEGSDTVKGETQSITFLVSGLYH